MAQYLRLPINDCKITASYKNEKYKQKFKFSHFGTDMISNSKTKSLYALGNGKVIAVGLDGENTKSAQGYVCVIQYNDCMNRVTNKTQNLIITYFHLASMPKVKAGQSVTSTTLIGEYGATGKYVEGAHLHIQVDTDTKYPLYCYGITAGIHKVLKQGITDSTVDALDYLYIHKNQKLIIVDDEYCNMDKIEDVEIIPGSTLTKGAI